MFANNATKEKEASLDGSTFFLCDKEYQKSPISFHSDIEWVTESKCYTGFT
jgi:hypothetical protein